MTTRLLALLALSASCAAPRAVPPTEFPEGDEPKEVEPLPVPEPEPQPTKEEKKPGYEVQVIRPGPLPFPAYDVETTSFFMDECMKTELATASYCACVLVQLHDLHILPAQVRSMVKAKHAPPRVLNAAKRCESKLKH